MSCAMQEILSVVRVAAEMGINRVRLSGGELWSGLVS